MQGATGEAGMPKVVQAGIAPRRRNRWIASLREDHYQVPNAPDQQASGIRDVNQERDDLIGFHWTHAFSGAVVLTLSPYYHFNSAHYIGGRNRILIPERGARYRQRAFDMAQRFLRQGFNAF